MINSEKVGCCSGSIVILAGSVNQCFTLSHNRLCLMCNKIVAAVLLIRVGDSGNTTVAFNALE